MSRAETVSQIYAELGRGDFDGAFALFGEDFSFDYSRSLGVQAGVHRGRGELEGLFRQFRDAWEEMHWDIHEIGERLPGVVFANVILRTRGAGSGVETTARGGHLWLFDGRTPVEARLYQTPEEAELGVAHIERTRRIAAARLYFVCDASAGGSPVGPLLDAAIAGGAEVIQLRDKELGDSGLIAAAEQFRAAADAGGALFIVNDRPDLVAACEADGVHVGQDDMPVAEARRLAGPGALVGLSTHTPEQVEAAVGAAGEARPDQLSVGPVWETPTKEGRPATGLGLVEFAAREATTPWYAIGGIDAENVAEVAAAGASRAVVVRAIRDAADPEAAARALCDALAAHGRKTERRDG